jgi:hypothetical protein
MEKHQAREWVASLEGLLDHKLKKWLKENPCSNGEVIQLRWTFEQTHIHLDIFWEDQKETISLHYLSPRGNHDFLWHGLDDKVISKISDRIGNLAQITMHPAIDPTA